LNSSLVQSAAELRLAKVWSEMADVTFCVTFLILSKIVFLSDNFGYRYARKPLKGSKDADFSLISNKIFSSKIARWFDA